MNLIAAVDRNWAIGNKGGLLARIPEDMQFFREKTVGRAVIMGRRTLESLPGGEAPSRPYQYCPDQKEGLWQGRDTCGT